MTISRRLATASLVVGSLAIAVLVANSQYMDVPAGDRIVRSLAYGFFPWLLGWIVASVGKWIATMRTKDYDMSFKWRFWVAVWILLTGVGAINALRDTPWRASSDAQSLAANSTPSARIDDVVAEQRHPSAELTDAEIQQFVDSTNADLPRPLNRELTLQSVFFDVRSRSLLQMATVRRESAGLFANPDFTTGLERMMVTMFCTDPDNRSVLDSGITAMISYFAEDGSHLLDLAISATDCKGDPVGKND